MNFKIPFLYHILVPRFEQDSLAKFHDFLIDENRFDLMRSFELFESLHEPNEGNELLFWLALTLNRN